MEILSDEAAKSPFQKTAIQYIVMLASKMHYMMMQARTPALQKRLFAESSCLTKIDWKDVFIRNERKEWIIFEIGQLHLPRHVPCRALLERSHRRDGSRLRY